MLKVKIKAYDVHNAILASTVAKALHGPGIKAVDAGLEVIAAEIRKRAPVDTGRLRDSIRVGDAKAYQKAVHGTIVIDEYYAMFIEFGTIQRPADPFIRTAVEASRSRARMAMVAAMKRG